MRALLALALIGCAAHRAQTVDEVLDRYKQALGGVDAIASTKYETIHAEVADSGSPGKIAIVLYAEPFKQRVEATLPNGTRRISGFDGAVSWSISPEGDAAIDTSSPLDSVRRDADLQYPLHQPDYFRFLELAGTVDFEGKYCYWLHGTTRWGKDNNQFYDVATGLLRGYRYESDDGTSRLTVLVFDDYKRVGARLVPTRMTIRTGDKTRTFIATSVSDARLPDSMFALPDAVKALLPAGG